MKSYKQSLVTFESIMAIFPIPCNISSYIMSPPPPSL